MRVLVTGGTGYFGSLLIKKLLERSFEVRNFDLVAPDQNDSHVEYVKGDIRDYGALSSAMKGVDIVYHNVAQVPLAKDKKLFWSVNYDGTKNVLKAAREFSVGKCVYTSSSAIFGVPPKNPVDETIIPAPQESYGAAKYAGEKLCHEYRKQGGWVSIIRPRTIIGHGRLGIFEILFRWISEGYNVPVLGGGRNIYQFVHADDLAEACILSSLKEQGETYNCGAAVYGTMTELLSELCAYAASGSKVVSLPFFLAVSGMKLTSALGLSPLGPYHALMYGRSMYFDISKAKRELHWEPKYSNFEMFRDSYDWYLENRNAMGSGQPKSLHRSATKDGILSLVKHVISI